MLQRIEQSVEVARRTSQRDRVEMDPAWNDVVNQATRLGIVQSARSGIFREHGPGLQPSRRERRRRC